MTTEKMRFKFQLTFASLVKFTSIMGLCFGVGSIPIIILLNLKNVENGNTSFLTVSVLSIIGAPLFYTIIGVIMGVVGYPLYKWLSTKVGIVYEGSVYPDDKEGRMG